jgi:hypothetical protein
MDQAEANEVALAQLRTLAEHPGALKIIVVNHACGGGVHPSKPGFDQEACDSFGYDEETQVLTGEDDTGDPVYETQTRHVAIDLADPRHYEWYDVAEVVSAEREFGPGLYVAYSEGRVHATVGYPVDLLPQLQKWASRGPRPAQPRARRRARE